MRRLSLLLALLALAVFTFGDSASGGGWDPDPKVACENGLDDDGDGWVDDYDPGCHGDQPFPYMDDDETNPPPPPEWFIEGEIPGDGEGDPSDETGSVCRQKELKRSMSEAGPRGRRLFSPDDVVLRGWSHQIQPEHRPHLPRSLLREHEPADCCSNGGRGRVRVRRDPGERRGSLRLGSVQLAEVPRHADDPDSLLRDRQVSEGGL